MSIVCHPVKLGELNRFWGIAKGVPIDGHVPLQTQSPFIPHLDMISRESSTQLNTMYQHLTLLNKIPPLQLSVLSIALALRFICRTFHMLTNILSL